jgi:hypothetical protein
VQEERGRDFCAPRERHRSPAACVVLAELLRKHSKRRHDRIRFQKPTDGHLCRLLEDSHLQGVQQVIDYIRPHRGRGRAYRHVQSESEPAHRCAAGAGCSGAGKDTAYLYCFDREMPGDDAGLSTPRCVVCVRNAGPLLEAFVEADTRLSDT